MYPLLSNQISMKFQDDVIQLRDPHSTSKSSLYICGLEPEYLQAQGSDSSFQIWPQPPESSHLH